MHALNRRPVSTRLAWRAVALLVTGVASQPVSAQAFPQLVGRTEIGLRGGTISADVCLTDLVTRGDTMTVALNRAFTLTKVTGAYPDPVAREDEPGGNAVRYTFAGVGAPADGASAASGAGATLCLEYSGRFPVHDVDAGEYRAEDASNVVAFTGGLVRARGISRWHPTTHDPATGLTTEAVRWRLEVACPECALVYVNGQLFDGPGPINFVSAEPRELLLVAGDLSETRAGGMSFIGAPVPADSAEAFSAILAELGGFLETYTGVPFGPLPDVIAIAPAHAPRRGSLWGFLGDPALGLLGMSVPELLSAVERTGGSSRRQVLGFLSHELAHRYFAWRMGAGTPQRDFFGEPFAVYLELKAVRHIFGEAEYLRGLARLLGQAARLEDYTPLPVAGADDFARSGYRYGYAPLALFSLEQAIGEPAMRDVLKVMLEASAAERYTADFGFLVSSAIRAGVPVEVLRAWETRCVSVSLLEGDCLPELDHPVARARSGDSDQIPVGRTYASTSSAPGGWKSNEGAR
jgi:hypothetical protein